MTMRRFGSTAVALVLSGACHSDLVTVPVPPTAVAGAQLGDSAGGEALHNGAIGLFATGSLAVYGAFLYSGTMADEFYSTNGDRPSVQADSRTVPSGGQTAFDRAYIDLQKARIQALQSASALEGHAANSNTGDLAEVFALAGYVEVLLAEDLCSGVPLGQVTVTGTVTNGQSLSTDSLIGRALAHFDSATAHAAGSTAIVNLAAVGRGRALLDLGRYGDAAQTVAQVDPAFVYMIALPTGITGDIYHYMSLGFDATMADRKGMNGLDYIAAHDARLPTLTAGAPAVTYPSKFGSAPSSNGRIPLADGVEAGLVHAEAALAAGDTVGWLGTLNGLRMNFTLERGPYPADTTYHQLQPLSDPGSDTARVTLTFRERAFWLYGTGHRLGDLRRLVRWYGRNQAVVFPTGPYVNGSAGNLVSSYGTDVNFPLSTVESGNPNFHGCLSSGA